MSLRYFTEYSLLFLGMSFLEDAGDFVFGGGACQAS